MSLSSELYDNNPWWESPDKINEDPKIKEWNSSTIKWDPRIRRRFDFNNDILYSLRGPRQVGKTTLIKLQIRDFLKQKISSWNIMYYSFDVDKTPKNLIEIIENYLDNTKTQRGNKRFYLFLDEVSKVKDWQDGIKQLHDQGKLKNCTVILTGSHTIDLKKSLENLTGRRGKTDDAYDKILLPMKFSEYVSVRDPELKDKLSKNGLLEDNQRTNVFTQLLNLKIDASINNMHYYIKMLNNYLLDYMLTGGLAQVVNVYHTTKFLNLYLYSTYLEYVLGDLKNLKRNEQHFRQLISHIIKNISWPHSWISLQKETEIRNSNTVGDYVYTLQSMFVLTMFYHYDPIKKHGITRKNKKIHFHDPFFLHSINLWLNGGDPFKSSQKYVENESNQGSLVEGIVGDHLIRLAFRLSTQKQNFNYNNHVFFWNVGKGKEVDFILRVNDIELPIEVKYQNNIYKKDFKGINYFSSLAKTEHSLILSKNRIGIIDNRVVLPASLFLLLV